MEQPSGQNGERRGRRQSRRLQASRRSRKGCPECRGQKIKCDEVAPACGQCRKRNRECHLQDYVFKQHALSTEVVASSVGAPPQHTQDGVDDSRLGTRDTSLNEELDTSSNVGEEARNAPTNVPTVVEYPPPVLPFYHLDTNHLPNESIQLLDSTDQVALDTHENGQHFAADISAQSSHNVHVPLDTISSEDLQGNSHALHEVANSCSLSSPVVTTDLLSGEPDVASFKDTQEELCLLRHYSDRIAPWMDLLYRYEVFSREVLTLARNHPILRYAACAVAAKQLGQMSSPMLHGKTQQHIAANMARGRFGFLWYGIKYYEKAIQTLVKSITPREHAPDSEASPAVSLSRGDLMVRAEGEDPIVRLLGTCILIQYEHLSANRDAWSGHLTGFSKLLDLIEDGRLLQPYPMFEQVYPWTKDIMEVKAGFWNFVVNDLEESFVAHRPTRIDTENLALWRNMGLLVDDDGRLSLVSGPNSLSTTPEHARDKVLSYTLIRLLCKLIDFLAPSPRWTHGASHERPEFEDLESQIDSWYQMVSPSFHFDGQFLAIEPHGEDGNELFQHELWFSNDLCSVTMMYYHMARMLLMINRPPHLLPPAAVNHDGGSSFDLLCMFRETEQKLKSHAAEVIAIVRGTPDDAVKLRAIQPLYVAGRCCTETGDRKRLLYMLTDIQDNLGIATGYRIQELLREWGASYQDFGMEARLTVEEQLP